MNAKEGNSQAFEDRHSGSFEDEQDGLISGLRGSPPRGRQSTMMTKLLPILLLLSIGLNIFQLVYVNVHEAPYKSLYVKMPEREKDIAFWYGTEYSEGHEEDKEALWNAIDISEGFVALTHEETDAMNLPRSETFPWDPKKGIYVAHGYHALHCVTLLHAFTHDAHLGKKPIVSYHHIEHCLDLLRQDVMCYADDVPDYTPGHGSQYKTGDNQHKKCRDWSKLQSWVRERSACYRTINITRAGEDHGVEHQLDRYTYCPEGSPYIPLIEAWKDMNRKNPGNLDPASLADKTEAELNAEEAFVNKHNADILMPDDIEPEQPFW